MEPEYTTPISITNQFYFCGLPLRLDTYRGCGFQCGFCFARRRGGNLPEDSIIPASSGHIKRIIERALGNSDQIVGMVAQFLRHRVPIHFGGMSDPFQPLEQRYRITEQTLHVLAEYDYPTVISTRSALVATPRYLKALQAMRHVIVQFSLSSADDGIASKTEPYSDPPSEILKAMEKLANLGIPVTCRWQPYIPEVSESCAAFVPRVSSAGCTHLGFEHLKVPLERNAVAWRNFNSDCDKNLYQIYQDGGAQIDGREYVLPGEAKRERILEVACMTRAHGMTFGAADNEFQFLSDTDCCCSGVDKFPGFENFFRHQIAYAVRKCKDKEITYEAIKEEWCPTGSIDRFLNSKSRLTRKLGIPSTISDHIRRRWNEAGISGSPSSFFGVVPAGESLGMKTYKWAKEYATNGSVESTEVCK